MAPRKKTTTTGTGVDDVADRNATRAELEQLNGLLTRTLIAKLQSDEATSTDIGNAVKIIVHNRVSPKEPDGYLDLSQGYPLTDLDFPVNVDGPEGDDN